jgi:hypothetical protein
MQTCALAFRKTRGSPASAGQHFINIRPGDGHDRAADLDLKRILRPIRAARPPEGSDQPPQRANWDRDILHAQFADRAHGGICLWPIR